MSEHTAAKAKAGGAAISAPPTSQRARTTRTKQRILEAAHAAFVAAGLDGANIEAIAVAAGVNKGLVYRHFSSKEELFTRILESEYARMRAAESDLALESLDPREAIATLITFTWDYFNQNPDFLTLVSIENLCKGRHLQASDLVPAQGQLVLDVVSRGEAAGVFRPGIDPIQLWISIAAMCWFYIANRFTLSATFGAKMLSPAGRRQRLKHIIDMVLHDLEAPGGRAVPGTVNRTTPAPRRRAS